MPKRTKKSRDELLKLIRSFRGMLKTKSGEKSVIQKHLEERRAERELEERKFQRLTTAGKNKRI